MSFTHAFEFLSEPTAETPDVVSLFGTDSTLRSWVLHQLIADGDASQWEGESLVWADLRDELATASLFNLGSKRWVVVRNADKFVSDHRGEIESFIDKPSGAATLVLETDALASNTRIYKRLHKEQLLIACGSANDAKQGVTADSRRKFLMGFVASRNGTRLAREAADLLVEMIGEDFGMLDTEIAKLALYCEAGQSIDEPLVREIVAGWQGKTVWQITDAIAAGNAAEALRQLDKLMEGGSRPIALLPQIAWWLRRLGMATTLIECADRAGRRWRMSDALGAAGISRPADVKRATSQLKGLRRERAIELLPWLLDADLRLKGTHSADGRDRFWLELLVIKLSRSHSPN